MPAGCRHRGLVLVNADFRNCTVARCPGFTLEIALQRIRVQASESNALWVKPGVSPRCFAACVCMPRRLAWTPRCLVCTPWRLLLLCVRPGAWLGRLRGCPPRWPRANCSPFMPLRRPSQAPGQRAWWACAGAKPAILEKGCLTGGVHAHYAGKMMSAQGWNIHHTCKIRSVAHLA
jgi:hypothetical protein